MGTKNWSSEYEDKCAQLRKYQNELGNLNDMSVAGLSNVKHDFIPPNFVWKPVLHRKLLSKIHKYN